jgi:hypothetical protein
MVRICYQVNNMNRCIDKLILDNLKYHNFLLFFFLKGVGIEEMWHLASRWRHRQREIKSNIEKGDCFDDGS